MKHIDCKIVKPDSKRDNVKPIFIIPESPIPIRPARTCYVSKIFGLSRAQYFHNKAYRVQDF